MTAAPPALSIKQSLNKAFRLIKPKRQAMETFKENLVKLLGDLDEKGSILTRIPLFTCHQNRTV